eukprot:6180731-Pleurochrysis_carterae.AAC.2
MDRTKGRYALDQYISFSPFVVTLPDEQRRVAPAHPRPPIVQSSPRNRLQVEQVTRTRGGIINPITSDGKILAAGPTGLPVVAATGNEWLADVMLSGYAKYSLSFNLAALFPGTVQAYYDAWLEAGFNAAVPTLAALKAAAPAP